MTGYSHPTIGEDTDYFEDKFVLVYASEDVFEAIRYAEGLKQGLYDCANGEYAYEFHPEHYEYQEWLDVDRIFIENLNRILKIRQHENRILRDEEFALLLTEDIILSPVLRDLDRVRIVKV